MSTWSMSLGDLVLVPRPRLLVPTGIGPRIDDCPVASMVDPAVPAQGFRLDITEAHGARIAHRDDAGLRYARSLLDQLLASPVGDRVLGVHVEDHPDIAVRGFMLDVSRDRVPTRATLDELVDVLDLCRYNQLQLYIEHTFAHVGHEAVWAGASPLTPDDLRWLDARCHAVGIELVVNRNCFGHFERWLAHPAYVGRAESAAGAQLMPGLNLPAAVLAPTQANADFALGLVREQLACVRSRRVNIGCDETFELGQGVSAAACAERGKGAVYLEHVRRLADPLLADGCEAQIWADVLRRHPELAATLPAGVVPIAWLYEAPGTPEPGTEVPSWLAEILHEVGIDTDTSGGFEANVAPLVAAGVPFWVAPGTGDWNSLCGRTANAFANQIDAAEAALRHGAGGYLVTAWGDNGHHHPPSVTYHSLVHGGAVAWCLEANRDLDAARVLSRLVFDDPSELLGSIVAQLGHLCERTGKHGFNASPLAAALFPHLPLLVTGQADPDAVRDLLAAIDDIETQLDRAALDLDLDPAHPTLAAHGAAATEGGDGGGGADDGSGAAPSARPQVVAELRASLRLARQGAWRLHPDVGPSVAERMADLAEAIDLQQDAWLGRARPGGLTDSLGHLRRTLAADQALLDG